jgi:NADH:ubiquinone oxidoreductase subunit 6 (subunit J)
MISWIFGGLTILAAASATFAPDLRRSNLSLWIAGLSAGALYLTVGAELLAIIQWIVSTLVAIAILFFSSMYGQSRELPEGRGARPVLKILLPLLLGLAFGVIIWHGAGFVDNDSLVPAGDGGDLQAMGRELIQKHLLSLEVLSLTLFLVLVGGGVIARPEGKGGAQEGGA